MRGLLICDPAQSQYNGGKLSDELRSVVEPHQEWRPVEKGQSLAVEVDRAIDAEGVVDVLESEEAATKPAQKNRVSALPARKTRFQHRRLQNHKGLESVLCRRGRSKWGFIVSRIQA